MKARENPFASHQIEQLPFRFPGGDNWESVLARLAALKWRGAIVGLHGAGKTTFLEQIIPHLESRGFRPHTFRLNLEQTLAEKQAILDGIKGLRAPDFVLLDGAEQLTTRQWLPVNAIAATCAGLIITQHRTGKLPTLLECEASPAILEDLVLEVTGAYLPEGEAVRMHTRHRGNLRECLRELYDRWAG